MSILGLYRFVQVLPFFFVVGFYFVYTSSYFFKNSILDYNFCGIKLVNQNILLAFFCSHHGIGLITIEGNSWNWHLSLCIIHCSDGHLI